MKTIHFKNASEIDKLVKTNSDRKLVSSHINLDNSGVLEFSEPVSLESLKNEVIDKVVKERDLKQQAFVTIKGHEWQCDEHSANSLTRVLLLNTYGVPLPATWRDANNNNVPVNFDSLLNILKTINEKIREAYSWSWAKKESIRGANDLNELREISITD